VKPRAIACGTVVGVAAVAFVAGRDASPGFAAPSIKLSDPHRQNNDDDWRANEGDRGAAEPSFAGPWTDAGFDGRWKSVRVQRADESILLEPGGAAERRGSAGLGELLPIYAVKQGSGCRSAWFEVGPHAWMCGDHLDVTEETPIAAMQHTLDGGTDGLPFRYYFVGPDGSQGYRNIADADFGTPDFEFESGFAVAITEERNVGGQHFGKTGNQLWIPMRDLGATHPTSFMGAEITDGSATVPFGWVVEKSTTVYGGASTGQPTSESLVEFVKVDVLEEKKSFGGTFTRIGDKKWIKSDAIRHPVPAAPPAEIDVANHERWVDVDLDTQTLIVMEGDKPVYATLVSTGRGKQGAYNATPIGTYHVWAKLTSANMDNLEDENANRYYRMETVPWVQFFSKGVALHGAFWHHSFGHVRSHGCVNLAPRDAEKIFYMTTPRIPAGWTAVLPSGGEEGTLVRVR
jgi:lipoprotein-anchoring transpeptidase ErfK/SrfK